MVSTRVRSENKYKGEFSANHAEENEQETRGIDDAMHEDRQPQVAAAKPIQQAEQETCQSGIQDPGDTLVGMPETEEDGICEQGENQTQALLTEQVHQAVEQVSTEEHLLDKGGFSPGEDEGQDQGEKVAAQGTKLG